MERSELTQFYMSENEKSLKLQNLKEQKKVLKQRLKALEGYRQMVEAQMESVLDQIDYLNIYC